jgi:carbon-monoxide dehydrogenase iron sulfur subunit
MSPRLVVQPENCTGCKSCMLACSFAHTNAFSYRDSRIRVVKDESRGQSTPLVCRQCEDAPCIEASPRAPSGGMP